MKIKRAWIILLTVISALLIITGCDSRTGSEINYKVTSLNVSEREIYNDMNNQTYSIVTASVEDDAGYPAAGIAVTFDATRGYIQGKVFTDEQGYATTNFNDDGTTGKAYITASVEESAIMDSIDVLATPAYTLYLNSVSPDTIFVDGGITSSTIKVSLKDESSFPIKPVTNETVYFTTTNGFIDYQVTTDSSGVATAVLRDDGTHDGEATVTVFHGKVELGLVVQIIPPYEVTDLDLSIIKDDGSIQNMNVNTSLAVNVVAEALSSPNDLALDGTEIIFTTDLGFFQTSAVDNTSLGKSIIATTSNGVAEVYFNSSTSAGLATITADAIQEDNNYIEAVSGNININPGIATLLFLEPDTTNVAVGSGDEVLITATVLDNYNNPLNSGKRVFFSTDLGSVTSPAQTDENGIAVATFSPGISAGVAEITATVDSAMATTVITVSSDEVNSIQFVSQQQVSIDVQGTGGDETAELAVNLFDMNGNLIDEPVEVGFEFISKPDNYHGSTSSNINNDVEVIGPKTYVMSSNGMAVVSVNSGVTSGIIKIKATCITTNGDSIYAQKSNIIVQAGQPHDCEFTIGGFDSGDDVGGGIWRVQIAAVITDQYNNPVSNGTAVFFTLGDEQGSGYSFASVETNNAFVGNENANGDSVAGTAYTHIIYDGIYTNEEVVVRVGVGEDDIEFNGNLKLPLQNGEITMLCVPTHVDWTTENNNEEILYTQCRINVRDGQNNPINKQRIMFTTSLGTPTDGEEGEDYAIHPTQQEVEDDEEIQEILEDPMLVDGFWQDLNIDDDEFDGYTGPYEGEFGRLYKSVGYYNYECPDPFPAPPGMTTGTITATIFGTTRSTNQTVTLLKYEMPD